MSYPSVERIELPVLQELVATGGVEDVRFLYDRLVAYFPQLGEEEVRALSNGHRNNGGTLQPPVVSPTARDRTRRGRWTITESGRSARRRRLVFPWRAGRPERTAQVFVAPEFSKCSGHRASGAPPDGIDYYDVSAAGQAARAQPRLRGQRPGSIDGALAKLKRAYDAQRTKPFLIVASERDTNRAQRQLSLARTGPFHEIGRVTTILSFEQLRRLHRSLTSVEDILAQIFER